jgi:hypothetical protein
VHHSTVSTHTAHHRWWSSSCPPCNVGTPCRVLAPSPQSTSFSPTCFGHGHVLPT